MRENVYLHPNDRIPPSLQPAASQIYPRHVNFLRKRMQQLQYRKQAERSSRKRERFSEDKEKKGERDKEKEIKRFQGEADTVREIEREMKKQFPISSSN